MSKKLKKISQNFTNNKMQNKKNSISKFNREPNIIEIKFKDRNIKSRIDLIPRSVNQENYLFELCNHNRSIVIATGPAGTGKTMLATLWAIKQLREKRFNKIVITRPNIAVDDKDIGFLPGDIMKKMTPWMMPILDIFKEYYSIEEIEYMLKNEILEICPIAYIRGRTFKNSIIIVDEAQGTTKNSMLSILTRIGEGSKMIITGDIKQSDRGFENGLKDLIEKIKNRPKSESETSNIALVRFTTKDVERHPAVSEILNMYQE